MSEASAIEAVVGWMAAMGRGDLTAAARWFDPQVSWRGIPNGVLCRDREEVLKMLADSQIPCPGDPDAHEPEPGLHGAVAVELISAGAQTVVLGAKVPGMSEVGGTPVHGQLYNVFRVRDGRIVKVVDYARREEALAAAGTRAPEWR
jgi:hypothetical protein